MDWIYLDQNMVYWLALENPVINLQAGNFLTSEATVSFSRRTLLHGVTYETNIFTFTIRYMRFS
jgi:hypothetical protein